MNVELCGLDSLATTFPSLLSSLYDFSHYIGCCSLSLKYLPEMSSNESFVPALTLPNIGIHIDPDHNLWLDRAAPSLEDVKSRATLEVGEVTVAVKTTGICG